MSTFFMEKSFVIAAVLKTKQLHFGQNFVLLEECNVISNLLQKEYNKKYLNVCITDTIDSEYFKVEEGVIFINKERGYDMESIETRYQGYCSNIDILVTLWNDRFILEELKAMRK